jgi:hypothetical protein
VPTTTTPQRAEQVANVLLAVAAIGIVAVVVRTPTLRRMAWRVAVDELTRTLPLWLKREVRQAWDESGQRGI